ncbi:unnamed protein product [Linum tenue]|uniref:Uncharacterized protein n=1 Tax=Linum tenue TaxID=586396 RepID=A0AAV0LDZ7_9ROSI|nr:unnamed protein product [Linum tenue]
MIPIAKIPIYSMLIKLQLKKNKFLATSSTSGIRSKP